MSDLIATSLAIAFEAEPLFTDVSLTIDGGDRVALVGPNGAGKTTLLRMLSGQLAPHAGSVKIPSHLHVALHDQRPHRSSRALREWVAPERIVEVESQLRALEIEMASGDPEVMNKWEDARNRYDSMGGEGWHVLVDQVLRGLGFRDDQMEQSLDSLSGGELTRASLARTLASQPDILLLDEPTNHLDIETIDWLQEYLQAYRGGLILVSHDRWFIETVCTSVIEVVAGKARRFNGSFVEYRAQQALEAASHAKHVERWQAEVATLQRFVDRFSAGTRSRQAQSKAKVLDKLRQDVPAYTDLRNRRGLNFKLPKVKQPGRTVFEAKQINLGFGVSGEAGSRDLLEPTDLVVERGEKIALLGANGAGKSTLLHALAAASIPLLEKPAGLRSVDEITVGYDVSARLISQHDTELVDSQSMLGNMNLASPDISRTEAQNLLGLFGFGGDAAERLVGSLSGGERRRLLLSMALTGNDNVLLLDEPTNHLDIESREALESALDDWQGTLILISHDRALVEGVASRTVVLHERQLHSVLGGYDAVRELLSPQKASPPPPATELKRVAKTRTVTASDSTPAASQGSKRRKVRRDGKPKVRRPATIEAEIEQLDTQMTDLNNQMLDPDTFTDAAKSAECLETLAKLERQLSKRWTELERSTEVHG